MPDDQPPPPPPPNVPHATPAAPPTDAGALLQHKGQTTWPIVLGIISIVFGGGAAAGGLCGMFAVQMFSSSSGAFQSAELAALQPTGPMRIVALGVNIASILLGLVLLFGGIALLRRRRSARTVCLTWSALKFGMVVATVWFQHALQQANMETMMANDPNLAGSMASGIFVGMSIVGVVLGLLWGWALPVFLLVWFGRGKIKDEVAGWS